jgi:hypothetical protein
MTASRLRIPGQYYFDSFQPEFMEPESPYASDGMETDTDRLTEQLESTQLDDREDSEGQMDVRKCISVRNNAPDYEKLYCFRIVCRD